jgi:CelD/BcsL family acetyltransferase involved in cellulose biosynthesis
MQQGSLALGSTDDLSLTDAPPRSRPVHGPRSFAVDLFDGRDFAAARWPSVAAGPELQLHAFQSREFLDVWTATIGRARAAQCFLVVVADAHGKPVLYLPLAIETRFGVRILRFMDAGVVDLNAPILAAGKDLTRGEFLDVWGRILSLLPAIDVLDLQKMPATVGAAHNPLTYLACRPYPFSGNTVDLGQWRQVVARPSTARVRRKLQRHLLRLNKLEPTAFLMNPSGVQWHKVMGRLTDVKRKQYLRTTARDFFAAPGVLSFYREIAAPERLGHISHLSALTLGGDIVAAHLGFTCRDRFYYVLPGFDTEYRSFAVGLILLERLMGQCVGQHYRTFDLGEGDYEYKETWTTHRAPLWSCEQGLTFVGRIYDGLRRTRRFCQFGGLRKVFAGGDPTRSARPADGEQ